MLHITLCLSHYTMFIHNKVYLHFENESCMEYFLFLYIHKMTLIHLDWLISMHIQISILGLGQFGSI